MRLCDVDAAQTLSLQREELLGRVALVERGSFSIVIGKLNVVDLIEAARGAIVAELQHRIARIDDRLGDMGVVIDVAQP